MRYAILEKNNMQILMCICGLHNETTAKTKCAIVMISNLSWDTVLTLSESYVACNIGKE